MIDQSLSVEQYSSVQSISDGHSSGTNRRSIPGSPLQPLEMMSLRLATQTLLKTFILLMWKSPSSMHNTRRARMTSSHKWVESGIVHRITQTPLPSSGCCVLFVVDQLRQLNSTHKAPAPTSRVYEADLWQTYRIYFSLSLTRIIVCVQGHCDADPQDMFAVKMFTPFAIC